MAEEFCEQVAYEAGDYGYQEVGWGEDAVQGPCQGVAAGCAAAVEFVHE